MATQLLAPEAVVERLRALREQIDEFTPLTPEQRRELTPRTRISAQELQASINVVGVLEHISQAVGHGLDDVQRMIEEADRWTTVEHELLAMWHGVHGANLLRRRRIDFIAFQAAGIGARLVRDPAHAVLVPHMQEIRRLRSFARRRKAAPEPEAPQTPQQSPEP